MAEHESLFDLQEEGHRDLKLITIGKQSAEFNSGNKRSLGLSVEGIRPKEGPDWPKVTNPGCGRTGSQAACLLSCV